jgi:hypothetical protein
MLPLFAASGVSDDGRSGEFEHLRQRKTLTVAFPPPKVTL